MFATVTAVVTAVTSPTAEPAAREAFVPYPDVIEFTATAMPSSTGTGFGSGAAPVALSPISETRTIGGPAEQAGLDLAPLARALVSEWDQQPRPHPGFISLDVADGPSPVKDVRREQDRADLSQAGDVEPLGHAGLGGSENDVDALFLPRQTVSLAYRTRSATARAGQFDVDVQPTANLVMAREVSGAGAGALVRIGQNFTEARSRSEQPGWYVYAGADAQALTYKVNGNSGGIADAVRVEDKLMVGDAQVGVALKRRPNEEFALGFVHREVTYEGNIRASFSRDERFLGFSYALVR